MCPARRNSAYASSITTTPVAPGWSISAHSSPITSCGSAVPVGLFGEGSRITLGWCSSTSRRASSRSKLKSSWRRPATQVVIASRAYSGYIEYVGANETAVRPGPPNACRICSITSLEPFAAHTCSGATGKPASPAEVRREAGAQLGELAVRVAVERRGGQRDRPGDVVDHRPRGRVGVLVDVEADGHVELGRAVRLDAAELGAQRWPAAPAPRVTSALTGGRSAR